MKEFFEICASELPERVEHMSGSHRISFLTRPQNFSWWFDVNKWTNLSTEGLLGSKQNVSKGIKASGTYILPKKQVLRSQMPPNSLFRLQEMKRKVISKFA